VSRHLQCCQGVRSDESATGEQARWWFRALTDRIHVELPVGRPPVWPTRTAANVQVAQGRDVPPLSAHRTPLAAERQSQWDEATAGKF
jgi:hypothetical protein